MKLLRILLLIPAMLLGSMWVQAQEKDAFNPVFFELEYFKFEPENKENALWILEGYFSEASRIAGFPQPVLQLEINSNDYNYLVLWELLDGEHNYIWQTVPTNHEWYNALLQVAGGEENAKALMERFDSYVVRSKTEVARRP